VLHLGSQLCRRRREYIGLAVCVRVGSFRGERSRVQGSLPDVPHGHWTSRSGAAHHRRRWLTQAARYTHWLDNYLLQVVKYCTVGPTDYTFWKIIDYSNKLPLQRGFFLGLCKCKLPWTDATYRSMSVEIYLLHFNILIWIWFNISFCWRDWELSGIRPLSYFPD